MTLPPIGFPAQSTSTLLRNLLSDLKGEADVARVEAVTGRIEDVPKALGGRVREPLELERDFSDLEQYRQIIAIAETRSAATQGAIENLRTLTDDLTNQATLALQNGTQNGLETMSRYADESLRSAISSLNTSIGGRAIFSGDAGDVLPLADAETIIAEVATLLSGATDATVASDAVRDAFNDPGGLFETTLYAGGTGDAPAAEIAEGERVNYQSRADEQVYRDITRNYAVLAVAYDPATALPDDVREGIAEAALLELRNAVDPLNRESARIGVAEERMDTMKARHIVTETALTESLNDLTGADALTAAARMQEVEGQLEILFLTTARLSQLSLSNFLR
ncbi:MAG: hypothetical protein AAFU49_10120 [Pseudomonadota bacterium]